MKYSKAGRIGWASAAGVGTDLDRLLIARPAGVGSLSWDDDEHMILNLADPSGKYYLTSVNAETGAVVLIDGLAANRARAGGDVIVAWPGNIGGVRMYPAPIGSKLEFPGDDLADVSHEGIVALQPGYTGFNLAILRPDGTPLVGKLVTGQLYFDAVSGTWAVRVRGHFLAYISLGTAFLWHLDNPSGATQWPVAPRTEGRSQVVPVPTLDQSTVVLIEASDRLTARYWDSHMGIVLAPMGAETFSVDAVLDTDTQTGRQSIRVAWSNAPGEHAGSIEEVVFDLAMLAPDSPELVDLNAAPEYPPFAPLPRPAFVGCYPDHDAHLPHENCWLEYGPGGPGDPHGWRFVSARGTFPWIDVEQFGRIGVTPAEALKVQPPGTVVYTGSRVMPSWAAGLVTPGNAVAAAFYLNPGEDPTDLAIDLAAYVSVAQARGWPVIVVVQGWNRGTCTDAEVHEAMAIAHDAAMDLAGVIALFVFGKERGAQLEPPQWIPIYGTWVDQFDALKGTPVYPAPTPPPVQKSSAGARFKRSRT